MRIVIIAIFFPLLSFGAKKECTKYLRSKKGKVIETFKENGVSNAKACKAAHLKCKKQKSKLKKDDKSYCSFEK